jgi:hypothetical protein
VSKNGIYPKSKMKKYKKKTFKDAWVISGGSYMGCMQLVGEAFKENSLSIDPSLIVPVLGIANWCTAANYESLIRPKVIKKCIWLIL